METKHNYSKGIDAALQAQQLRDILKVNPNVKVFVKAKRSGNKGFEDTPLFKKEIQTNLF